MTDTTKPCYKRTKLRTRTLGPELRETGTTTPCTFKPPGNVIRETSTQPKGVPRTAEGEHVNAHTIPHTRTPVALLIVLRCTPLQYSGLSPMGDAERERETARKKGGSSRTHNDGRRDESTSM